MKYPDPRLRAKNATIKVFGERLQELADELFEVMYQYGPSQISNRSCFFPTAEDTWPLLARCLHRWAFTSTRLRTGLPRLLCRDDGVGLAAPQVGLNLRLMVFNATGEKGKGQELVLANPRIISSSGLEPLEEGCLSFKYGTEMILGDVEVRTATGLARLSSCLVMDSQLGRLVSWSKRCYTAPCLCSDQQ